MKYFILISIMLLEISYCQDFPRKDISLLYGKDLVVMEDPVSKKTWYSDFYNDDNLNSSYGNHDNYNLLVGKKFRLISYEPNKSKNIFQNERFYILKIVNESIGVLFYDYDSESKGGFPFEVVGGLNFPDDFYCKEIVKTFDKFTNETIYRSPETNGFKLIKVEKNNKSKIYLHIKAYSDYLTSYLRGAVLLLENNKRIEKADAIVDVQIEYFDRFPFRGYNYSTLIELNKAEINLLRKYNITDKRLSIYDIELNKNDDTLREFLICMTK